MVSGMGKSIDLKYTQRGKRLKWGLKD